MKLCNRCQISIGFRVETREDSTSYSALVNISAEHVVSLEGAEHSWLHWACLARSLKADLIGS